MIRMPQTVYQPKETATFEVLAAAPTVEVTDSEGKLQKVTVKSKSGSCEGGILYASLGGTVYSEGYRR